jgi:hypothetical protein
MQASLAPSPQPRYRAQTSGDAPLRADHAARSCVTCRRRHLLPRAPAESDGMRHFDLPRCSSVSQPRHEFGGRGPLKLDRVSPLHLIVPTMCHPASLIRRSRSARSSYSSSMTLPYRSFLIGAHSPPASTQRQFMQRPTSHPQRRSGTLLSNDPDTSLGIGPGLATSVYADSQVLLQDCDGLAVVEATQASPLQLPPQRDNAPASADYCVVTVGMRSASASTHVAAV